MGGIGRQNRSAFALGLGHGSSMNGGGLLFAFCFLWQRTPEASVRGHSNIMDQKWTGHARGFPVGTIRSPYCVQGEMGTYDQVNGRGKRSGLHTLYCIAYLGI